MDAAGEVGAKAGGVVRSEFVTAAVGREGCGESLSIIVGDIASGGDPTCRGEFCATARFGVGIRATTGTGLGFGSLRTSSVAAIAGAGSTEGEGEEGANIFSNRPLVLW